MTRVLVVAALAALATRASRLAAQPATVTGTVFDSLRGQPLAGAFVTILGQSRSTSSDALGRFRFDGLPRGTYTFSAQHDELDSLGLSGLSARATVDRERADVRLAVPAFATFWRTACPGPPPRDSGFVYGSIRDAASRAPVRGARIAVTWIEARAIGAHTPGVRRWRRETQTDSLGNYGVCGVPTDVTVRVRAATDSGASGLIDLLPRDARVRRRDLLVSPGSPRDSAALGTIEGTIADAAGVAVANARVLTDDAPEVRSGADGRFSLRGMPAGTRQVEIFLAGMNPAIQAVDVTPGSTATLAVQLRRVTDLQPVRITELARGPVASAFEERRRTGLGYARDSLALRGAGTMRSVLEGFPGVTVQRLGSSNLRFLVYLGQAARACLANVFVDGSRWRDQEAAFSSLHPSEVAAVEVYPRGLMTPSEFQVVDSDCGAVAIWTKFAFNRR